MDNESLTLSFHNLPVNQSYVELIEFLKKTGYRELRGSYTIPGFQHHLDEIADRLDWNIARQLTENLHWVGRPLIKVLNFNDKVLLIAVPEDNKEFWTLMVNDEDSNGIVGFWK